MISIINIKTVARYERKILSRSWFFRIFSALAILILGIFTAAVLFENSSFNWGFRAISSAVIYNALLMLNIGQSVIAIFLASDFLKRDKKLDTAEVLFIRPMSNSDYVLGKTWGILSLFIMLNLVVLLITAILSVSSGNVSLLIMPYVWYLLLISIPSLVFILGLSFFIMSLIRNQAITFLLLLAYIAGLLFYLAKREFYIFDFLAFKMPLIYSDIIGFYAIKLILLQRLTYLFAGIAFVLASIFLLKRLSQNRATKLITSLGFVLFLGISAACAFVYLEHYYASDKEHNSMADLSHAYFKEPTASLTECNLKVIQSNPLEVTAELKMVNHSGQDLKQLVYSLNPGLLVQRVDQNGKALSFTQNQFILLVDLINPLGVDDSTQVVISYKGSIKKSVSYLDVDIEKLHKATTYQALNLNQEYGFLSDKYVLLTIENMWYPISGVRYDATQSSVFKQDFTQFTLEVKTQPNLLPISQGDRVKLGENSYRFTTQKPLPQLSLAIGNYSEKTITVKDIQLNLVYFNKHDYFTEQLNEIADTLPEVLADFIENYERPLSMAYPFSTFSLVEVPVQYKSIEHSWTASMANSQPQMVFLPEKGFGIRQADFKSNKKRQEKRNSQDNAGLSTKELQSNLLKGFLNEVLASENEQVNFRNMNEGIQANPYAVFPNYYNFVNFIQSDICPALNYAIESYLNEGEVDPRSLFMSQAIGLTDADKANRALNGKSLKHIVDTEEDKLLVNKVLKQKGEYLLTWIQKQVGDEDFNIFLKNYLHDNRYKTIEHHKFADDIYANYNFQLNDFIDNWYHEIEIPAFIFSSIEYIKTVDDNQQAYLARLRVTNYGKVGGIVKFVAMFGQGRPGPGQQMETTENIYYINANETKEIQMVFNDMPRLVQFNTLISKNIPSNNIFRNGRNQKPKKDEKAKVEAYEKVIDQPVTLATVGEFICDNTSMGFSVFDPNDQNVIKSFFNKEDKDEIVGLNFWESPPTWKKTVNSNFYGEFEHSAMIVRSGEGDKTATWATLVDENGYYDIYAYIFKEQRRRRGRDDNSEVKGSYFFTVYHDDGQDEIEMVLNDIETGWNLLGSFYLSADSVKVQLSNKSEANRVFADAVKWAKEGAIEKNSKPLPEKKENSAIDSADANKNKSKRKDKPKNKAPDR